ncbi:hypothetical protein EYE40_08570 [Glaciihabitans arcticus]|uniref:Uncharacterized protein n=1 Tax=Glaciihabitans arcticus TaxID=2668039 RepID=A0A4Q9GYP3_9MICO|nr:hypothetical protein [Glaciihabitans arcticus]TBN57440.1 hypothetical protein EYE40_08570 [Glaciihabitans arcticus]
MTDVAANHLHAELVDRPQRGIMRLRFWVLAILGAMFQHEGPAVFDLVVRRNDTGREIMRTPADVMDPQHLLDTVEDDLETKTVAEFLAEWRVIE